QPAHLPDLHSFPTRRSSDLPVLFEACVTDRHSPIQTYLAGDRAPRVCGLVFRTSGGAYSGMRASDLFLWSPWPLAPRPGAPPARSEEHTSELQSRSDLVCRL